jgi:hypothetical protein
LAPPEIASIATARQSLPQRRLRIGRIEKRRATTQSAPPGVQPATRLNEKKNATALFRAPVSAAGQPTNRYAERTARHPAGAPGSEQSSPACHEILRGCRGEYRHSTEFILTAEC